MVRVVGAIGLNPRSAGVTRCNVWAYFTELNTMPNRLSHESSPYLLQHAHNPVDWYAWGPDAFEAARSQDKPIFLSVGYSTCYWCHVMERRSFENPAVAEVMNRYFINVKVDREERPDVDQLYMTAVQVQTGQGGWPMSAFLTPQREYFYGGTYFPPTDSHGRLGFVTLLNAVADAWRDRRGEVLRSASEFTRVLQQLAEPPRPSFPVTIDHDFLLRMLDRSTEDYDHRNGGFGSAPKFPRQTLLRFLLAALSPDSPLADRLGPRRQRLGQMLRHTLEAMMHGGIRDQLGGAFHRYSTDRAWIVPHFEIMLYDNAMLAEVYARAAAMFDEPQFAQVARDVLDFVLSDLTSSEGTFYTAIDAEVDAREGQPYVWTRQEIEALLDPDDARLFCRVYGVADGPNFADPHGTSSTPDGNVLFVADAEALGAHQDRLAVIRGRLLEARRRKKQPMRDTKLITSWNALMIGAMARSADALLEPRYRESACRAADALLNLHRRPDGAVLRSSRGGQPGPVGFLEDYAFLADALLALGRLDEARDVYRQMQARFGDADGGAFFLTDRAAADLPVRQKTGDDTPLPSACAVAAGVAVALGDFVTTRRTFEVFAESLQRHGQGMSAMLTVALAYLQTQPPVVVSPTPQPDRPPDPHELARRVVQITARQADQRRVVVELQIAEGWHIHGNPTAGHLVATSVRAPADLAASIAGIDYPPAVPLRADFSDEAVPVYCGRVELVIELSSPGDVRGRPLQVVYQPCDNRACLPVVQREVAIA